MSPCMVAWGAHERGSMVRGVAQVVVCTGAGQVVALELLGSSLQEVGRCQLPAEVACVDVASVGEPFGGAQCSP